MIVEKDKSSAIIDDIGGIYNTLQCGYVIKKKETRNWYHTISMFKILTLLGSYYDTVELFHYTTLDFDLTFRKICQLWVMAQLCKIR